MEDGDETDGLPMATSAPSPDPDRPDRGDSDRRRAPYAIKLPADTPTTARDKTAGQSVTHTPPVTRISHVLEDTGHRLA